MFDSNSPYDKSIEAPETIGEDLVSVVPEPRGLSIKELFNLVTERKRLTLLLEIKMIESKILKRHCQ